MSLALLKSSPSSLLATLVFAASWLMAAPLHAHEFWMVPVVTPLAVGDTARVGLRVGEFFEGDALGFSAAQTVALRAHTAAGAQDLLPLLALRGAVAELPLRLVTAGTTVLSFDSQPNTISLSADRFHAYLHDEGMDFIKARREATGSAKEPGRERYRRFVKTLIQSKAPGPVPVDATFGVVVGQQLEVVPLNDPLALVPGGQLGIQVLFEGKPLAGALLKAWHKGAGKDEGQTLIIRSTTKADGTAAFSLPYAGAWMVSVVHMIPAVGVKNIDWDSLWGNLTFAVAPAAAVATK
ncbi:MAG: DUF4198 domain-containing protein [Polaromonas sp.]|nr:DUF4198 domain-containing protein [Polaromonas sp.]